MPFITELMTTIISNCNDAAKFLKKRKVHRDYIIKYLAKEKIYVHPSSGKPQLVHMTLKHWSYGKVSFLL